MPPQNEKIFVVSPDLLYHQPSPAVPGISRLNKILIFIRNHFMKCILIISILNSIYLNTRIFVLLYDTPKPIHLFDGDSLNLMGINSILFSVTISILSYSSLIFILFGCKEDLVNILLFVISVLSVIATYLNGHLL